ncbi:unnamed protein product [Candidula unifasciata]|uniref:Protein FAM76A n=1 Tax=Candidula unifasciata TaxID=100452 RepID=A0A8S3ZXD8_9EUPU|nr:unnamed protein product [Candidula unifasciata]
MAALFSCTKCHKRYLFEELSKGEQLCKDCRNNFPVVKCTYCRVEFLQNSKGSTSTICAKCAQNVKYYGKPTACENCSILAAFIGNRCQRCVNSEKKWGPPLACEQCKLKCAFSRAEKKKLDGKLMCWLCNEAYRRVLEKTRKTQEIILKTSQSSSSLIDVSSKSNTPTSNGQGVPVNQPVASASFEGMTVLERLTRLATSGGSSRGNTPPVDLEKHAKTDVQESRLAERQQSAPEKGASGEEEEVKEEKEKQRSLHRHHHRKHSQHHHHHSRSKKHHIKDSEGDAGDVKKPKSDKNPADGVSTSTPKSTDGYVSDHGVDSAASENVILITQLREQIESLKKQMVIKDQQLVERDHRITELKVQMCEGETEFRAKVQAMHQSHATAIENCQIKNKELTRQSLLLRKNKKSTDAS